MLTRFRLFLIGAVCAGLCLPLGAWAQGRAAAVGVQSVDVRQVAETVQVFAQIVTARDGAVASRVAGNVDRVAVLVGSRVEEGALLVELNRDLLMIQEAQSEAQLAEADAAIATASIRVESALTNFSRIEALSSSAAFSQGRFDDAQLAMQEARSQLVEAQARKQSSEAGLAESRYQLERSHIVAPFAGVVLEVNTLPGAFIQAGSPVVRLLDTQAFEVQAGVPARFVSGLTVGHMVQASTENGVGLELEVRAVLPLEDPTTRTRAVRFAAPGLADIGDVAVGQSLTVQVPVGVAREALSVPKDALVQARGGWTVFVAVEGKAEPRTVEIGVPLGDRYEVISGLAPGDQVVVRGNERLRPGQDIAPSPVETN